MTSEKNAIKQLAFDLRETLGKGARLVRVENSLPLPQLTVMGHLMRNGTMSMTDLATAERVRPQSMSTTIKALEKEGLIKRTFHPHDGRATLLQLSEKGLKTLDDVFLVREDWLSMVISSALTESERSELVKGLKLIQRIINKREMI